ncbi:MAG: xanthine dehydrogenase family protein subunit M [Candidatus Marinimicrobia bacterium]|nr:xanthine dehydrogenase family protein subunit M [Candidatus Neomarinimicrobiota bacterium]
MRYYSPASLKEFFKISSQCPNGQKTFLAGGTDLMPCYEQGTPLPDHLIDLKHLRDLHSISVTENTLIIGALTTIQDLHDHPLIQGEFVALYQATHEFAGAQIRHRGTIGGNICNASPAGDLLPPLYAFDAQLILTGPQAERHLPIHEFILGPGKTALLENEILTSISLNRKRLRSQFQKVGLRQSMAISVVNLACTWEEDEDGFSMLEIAAGAVAPTVLILNAFTRAYLENPKKLPKLLQLIDEAIAPIDDIRATANYRRMVLKNLIWAFLTK